MIGIRSKDRAIWISLRLEIWLKANKFRRYDIIYLMIIMCRQRQLRLIWRIEKTISFSSIKISKFWWNFPSFSSFIILVASILESDRVVDIFHFIHRWSSFIISNQQNHSWILRCMIQLRHAISQRDHWICISFFFVMNACITRNYPLTAMTADQ